MWLRAALGLAAAMLLGGCSLLEGFVPNLRPGPTPQPAQIEVSNGTTLDLALFVNGTQVASIPGGGGTTVPPDRLPPMPWSVEARSSSGRVVASFGATTDELEPVVGVDSTGWTIAGDRVDLSCGMLVMFAGTIAIVGPVPGPGTPGDCVP